MDLAQLINPLAEEGFVHFSGEVVGGFDHGVWLVAADRGDGSFADSNIQVDWLRFLFGVVVATFL